jgi:oleandomycin transport system ATP-binding protein
VSGDLAIEAHDLTKVFAKGNVRALDGLSFQTPPGTILGVLGPNGAGKTTAVRILSTVITPDGSSGWPARTRPSTRTSRVARTSR